MACPASPVHYQYNPVKTMKTCAAHRPTRRHLEPVALTRRPTTPCALPPGPQLPASRPPLRLRARPSRSPAAHAFARPQLGLPACLQCLGIRNLVFAGAAALHPTVPAAGTTSQLETTRHPPRATAACPK
eukprot:scaffold3819_cov107-Isochrysis_galbana.AAC.16